MAQNFALITFKHDERAYELLDMSDAARAVAEGALTPETQLTLYGSDGSIGVHLAKDVPDLGALWQAARDVPSEAPVRPSPKAEPAPEPIPVPEREPIAPPISATPERNDGHDHVLRHNFSDGHDGPAYLVRWCVEPGVPFEAGDFLCIVQTEFAIIRIPAPGAGRLIAKNVRTHSPVSLGTQLAVLRLDWRPDRELAPDIRYFASAEPAQPVPQPPSTPPVTNGAPVKRAGYRRRRLGCGGWLLMVIAMLIAVLVIKNWLNSPGEDRARSAAVLVESSDLGAADFRPPGEEVSRYLARRADFVGTPDDTARTLGQLERGGAINGIFVRNTDGIDWFWIASGPAEGHFVRANFLSQREPPMLIEQRERSANLVSDAAVFVWPDESASAQIDGDGMPILLSARDRVTVVGTTESEFYEIALTSAQGGGVGYIARAAIDGGVVAAPADSLLDRGISSASSALKKGAKFALGGATAPALKVTNQCPMDATVLFFYRAKEGWTHNNGASWDYRSGASGYPALPSGDRLYPVNGELLYAAAPVGQAPLRQGQYEKALFINGQEYHFRRARLTTLPNGDFGFALTC